MNDKSNLECYFLRNVKRRTGNITNSGILAHLRVVNMIIHGNKEDFILRLS